MESGRKPGAYNSNMIRAEPPAHGRTGGSVLEDSKREYKAWAQRLAGGTCCLHATVQRGCQGAVTPRPRPSVAHVFLSLAGCLLGQPSCMDATDLHMQERMGCRPESSCV